MRTLGILWILYGLERFAVALGIFLCIPTLTVMWGALLTPSSQSVDADGFISSLFDFRDYSCRRSRNCFHSGRSGP